MNHFPPIVLIVARSRNGIIGANGKIPWHCPEDLAFFKALTSGKPVIMGRRTWESLPKRPLPHRRNIVITSQEDYIAEGAEIASSFFQALSRFQPSEWVFVIGGERVYRQAMPYATLAFVTTIDADFEGDTYCPEFKESEWNKAKEIPFDLPRVSPFGFNFECLVKKKNAEK